MFASSDDDERGDDDVMLAWEVEAWGWEGVGWEGRERGEWGGLE